MNRSETSCGEPLAKPPTRSELEANFGQVWTEEEAKTLFELKATAALCFTVKRKADGVVGLLHFQGEPPVFFDFQPFPQS